MNKPPLGLRNATGAAVVEAMVDAILVVGLLAAGFRSESLEVTAIGTAAAALILIGWIARRRRRRSAPDTGTAKGRRSPQTERRP